MTAERHMLAIASYYKGDRFLEQVNRRGWRVHLLTQPANEHRPWPRQALAGVYTYDEGASIPRVVERASQLVRHIPFDLVVALDDYDVEIGGAVREHFRLPGMGDSVARQFRDKLAMRVTGKRTGIPVPDFCGVLNHDRLYRFMVETPPPWMLKPRAEASASGIRKLERQEDVWATLESLGDRQSHFVLERYVPGDVYHVDSLVSEGRFVFSAVHRCAKPPFDVAHGGGMYITSTVEHGGEDDTALRGLTQKVLADFGLVRGPSHVEWMKAHDGSGFYLLEAAARVGGAHIADLVEAATGVNLWQEWADLEVDAGAVEYTPPQTRDEYGGMILTLARQQHPDLSGYDDPEIAYRVPEEAHAGLVVRSTNRERVQTLLGDYASRFERDFHAMLPHAGRPSH